MKFLRLGDWKVDLDRITAVRVGTDANDFQTCVLLMEGGGLVELEDIGGEIYDRVDRYLQGRERGDLGAVLEIEAAEAAAARTRAEFQAYLDNLGAALAAARQAAEQSSAAAEQAQARAGQAQARADQAWGLASAPPPAPEPVVERIVERLVDPPRVVRKETTIQASNGLATGAVTEYQYDQPRFPGDPPRVKREVVTVNRDADQNPIGSETTCEYET